MLTQELRIHDAPTVPCTSCGASLPVDPTAANVWCAACHRWSSVGSVLRQRAFDHVQATQAADREQAAFAARAAQLHSEAERANTKRHKLLLVVGLWMVIGGVSGALSIVGIVIDAATDLAFEADVVSLALLALGGLLGAVLLLGAVGGCYWFYRLYTRHHRRKARRDAEWFARVPETAGAMCGSCGAPLAFRVGETAVTCGFCRAVVVPGEQHERRLIRLAVAQTQLARLHQAQAERAKLKADLSAKRVRTVYMSYAIVGSLALFALPVIAAAYAWRTLTFSLEEQLLQLADELSAEFGAGLDFPFEWLDDYWLGDTPPALRPTAPFQSRWSFEAVYHDRPVLFSATTNWSDRIAPSVVLLLARPRQRSTEQLRHLTPARAIAALGYTLHADYAGISISRMNVRARELTGARLTQLARAAYELAEERV